MSQHNPTIGDKFQSLFSDYVYVVSAIKDNIIAAEPVNGKNENGYPMTIIDSVKSFLENTRFVNVKTPKRLPKSSQQKTSMAYSNYKHQYWMCRRASGEYAEYNHNHKTGDTASFLASQFAVNNIDRLGKPAVNAIRSFLAR